MWKYIRECVFAFDQLVEVRLCALKQGLHMGFWGRFNRTSRCGMVERDAVGWWMRDGGMYTSDQQGVRPSEPYCWHPNA